MRETFDLSRNHYDRIVHASFGLLVTPTLRELVFRREAARTSPRVQLWITASVVLGVSGAYEITTSPSIT